MAQFWPFMSTVASLHTHAHNTSGALWIESIWFQVVMVGENSPGSAITLLEDVMPARPATPPNLEGKAGSSSTSSVQYALLSAQDTRRSNLRWVSLRLGKEKLMIYKVRKEQK